MRLKRQVNVVNRVVNIFFAGVGGQGTILASKILSEGLVDSGYDVKMSEVHGMAQRGGNVVTQIRFGEKVYSPIIEKGQVDVIVAFEKSEALRWVSYLRKNGTIIINNYEIHSVPVLIGQETYPKNIISMLRKEVEEVISIDAIKIGEELGNIKIQNIVLLGALIKVLKLENINWSKIIEENVKETLFPINKKALKIGMEYLEDYCLV